MPGIPDADAWAVFGQISSVLIFLAALAGAVWRLGFLRRDSKPHNKPRAAAQCGPSTGEVLAEIQRTQGEVAGLSRQVGEMELRTPGPDALGRIHGRLDDLNAKVAQLEGELKAANRSLHIIQEHLINK